jgi:hypothetical protein
MHSVGEQLVAKMVELLNAPDDKPMPTLRQDPHPIAVENPDRSSGLNGFLLYSVKEVPQRLSPGVIQRTRHVRVEIPVSGPPPLDAASDPLYLFVIHTLFSRAAYNALRTGRQEFAIEEVGLIWETISSYEDTSVCALELKFSFATTTDPSVRV